VALSFCLVVTEFIDLVAPVACSRISHPTFLIQCFLMYTYFNVFDIIGCLSTCIIIFMFIYLHLALICLNCEIITISPLMALGQKYVRCWYVNK
jgi:hypothetical protein